nr:zinc finger, CCHC-type, retrotransposon Gag domain protein [Tanacetum cinerariifolium]
MVNTRTNAELATAVQNALQTLLPQIHAEIREEFCTGSGPSGSGGNPLPFFPQAEQERLKREYHFIRQTDTETSTEFMQRFLRLAGFLRAAAGTVANAARKYEILDERDDDGAERPYKRQKSGDRHQPTTQQSSHRNHGYNNDRHGSDRRGGGDNHRSNNNYSGNNNRSSGNGRDQRNRGQQSN